MTNSLFKRLPFFFITGMLTTLLVLPGTMNTTFGQDEKLPTGESVLQKYVEATGGQAAYDKINNRYFEAQIDIVNAGVVLDVKTHAAKPNKLIATIEADAIGTIRKGCTGKAAWSMSDMQGPVLEQGAALENQFRDCLFDRLAYWKKAYESAECEAIEKVNDKDCYKVVLTPFPYVSEEAKDAEMSFLTVYFDKSTNLATKIESNIVTSAGTIDVTAHLLDYKTVDGIKIPHMTKLELVGQTRVMTIQSVKHNVELPDNHFDPPAEIQALLKKNEAEKNANRQTENTNNEVRNNDGTVK